MKGLLLQVIVDFLDKLSDEDRHVKAQDVLRVSHPRWPGKSLVVRLPAGRWGTNSGRASNPAVSPRNVSSFISRRRWQRGGQSWEHLRVGERCGGGMDDVRFRFSVLLAE